MAIVHPFLSRAPAWQLSIALHAVLFGIGLWAGAHDVRWEEMGTRADDLPVAFAPTPFEGFDAVEEPEWPRGAVEEALTHSARPAAAPIDPWVSELTPIDTTANPCTATTPSPDTLAAYLDWQSASKLIHPCKGTRWWLLYRNPLRSFRRPTVVWLAWTCPCKECRELCRSPRYPCLLRWQGKPRTGLTATERLDQTQLCYCRFCRPKWIPGYWERRHPEQRRTTRR